MPHLRQILHRIGKSNKFCGLSCYRIAQRSGLYKRGPEESTHRAPCANCGKEVVGIPGKNRKGERGSVYCDRTCYDERRTKLRESRKKQCSHCGKTFIPETSASKFCGQSCWKARKKAEPKRCLSCETLFTPVRRNAKTGKMISHNAGKTCSAKCHNDWIRNNHERKRKISEAFSGDKHPGWQGGKSLINSASSRGPNWKEQRSKAIKRDGACVDCGLTEAQSIEKYGKSLDVDHVVPYHNFSSYKKANELSNIECRCKSCHRKAESKRRMVQMVLPIQDSRSRQHKGQKGSWLSNASLSEVDVMSIRKRFDSGERIRLIWEDYPQIGFCSLSAAARRKTWKWIA